jgi:hypothetical protein
MPALNMPAEEPARGRDAAQQQRRRNVRTALLLLAIGLGFFLAFFISKTHGAGH